MKIDVTQKKNNILLGRIEVLFEAHHQNGEGTPQRLEVRKELAKKMKVDIENVYLRKLVTKSGTSFSVGLANIYKDQEMARAIEPEYIVLRNTITQR